MRRTLCVLAVTALAGPALAEPAPGGTITISPDRFAMPLSAERPVNLMVPVKTLPPVTPLVNSHVVFLNRCAPSGCKVKQGNTDSRTDTSDIIGVGQGTLGAWSYGDSRWNQVVDCVKGVLAPFNVTVTDKDPGMADHFEVMIGGTPSQLGLPQGVGGIADFPCTDIGVCAQYIPQALVFDFADVWNGDVTYTCGTAVQEIAHAWTLDHAVPADDPMTYNNYVSPLKLRNGAQCGSDCGYACPGGSGNCNAFGLVCSGSGGTATHICTETGTSTQNENDILLALFGPAGAQAPTVKITSPTNGQGIQSGTAFKITATCDSSDGVQEVDLSIDGAPKSRLTAPPFTFDGPTNLADGTHKITVLCGTKLQATATAEVSVVVGKLCSQDSDCQSGYICYGETCIAGMDVAGGLGATCTGNTDCDSGSCASDGASMACVIPCDPSNDKCPSGFGCLEAGTGGVCWFGVENGGGGCCEAGNGGAAGTMLLSLGIAATLVTRRRRARA